MVPFLSVRDVTKRHGALSGCAVADLELHPGEMIGIVDARHPVNTARGLAYLCTTLRLDEPAARLDPANRDMGVRLIAAAKARGAAMGGSLHDADAPARSWDRESDVSRFASACTA